MKVNVYVDGFNLYYGAVKGTPYRWLNLFRLCQLLLSPNDVVQRIRYFTALVTPRRDDPDQQRRQLVYLRALETIPQLTVHYGKFLSGPVRMPLAKTPADGPKTVEVLKTEEKGSDVNLATFLLRDGFRDEYEMAVVISNDSDLILPIEMVQAELGLSVGVLNPHKNTSRALQKAAAFYKPIRRGVLQASQFPNTLIDRHGTIQKPSTW